MRDVSFRVTKGEVVGLAGLAGSGPEAVLAAIAGLSDISQGRITLPSGADRPTHFRQATAAGVAFVSGDRRKLGLMLDKQIWENIVQVRSVGLARDGVFLSTDRLRRRAAELARSAQIGGGGCGGAVSIDRPVEELLFGCDRVLVFYRGGICAELSGADLTAPNLSEIMNTGEAPGHG